MAARILILRTDNIGDAIIFSGALKAIRAKWPDATIHLMTAPHVRPLFDLCPHVDRVLSVNRLVPWEVPRRHFLRGTWRIERILLHERVRRLWYPRYDRVLYPVSAPTEGFLRAVRYLEAPEKWGFAGEQLRIPQLTEPRNRAESVFTGYDVNTAENRWMHERERTRRFLEVAGVDAGGMHPELWLSDADHAAAARRMPAAGALGLFVGAGSRRRRWPVEKWAALAREQSNFGNVVLLGDACDRAVASAVRDRLRGSGRKVVDLAGHTTLRELAACIGRCGAVVSNDSCGLHLAVALGVPAVGILGGYHFGRYYPWGDARIHRVANLAMSCYYCNDACVHGDWRCVGGVAVETVRSELKTAVENRKRDAWKT